MTALTGKEALEVAQLLLLFHDQALWTRTIIDRARALREAHPAAAKEMSALMTAADAAETMWLLCLWECRFDLEIPGDVKHDEIVALARRIVARAPV